MVLFYAHLIKHKSAKSTVCALRYFYLQYLDTERRMAHRQQYLPCMTGQHKLKENKVFFICLKVSLSPIRLLKLLLWVTTFALMLLLILWRRWKVPKHTIRSDGPWRASLNDNIENILLLCQPAILTWRISTILFAILSSLESIFIIL